jgi:SAM-dependent methyltransferase
MEPKRCRRIRRVAPAPLPYRDFTYPLNVFMYILTREEGEVSYLHYALFERPGESILEAQERSTELLLNRLPPPPASILEVGIGLGTTLARLIRHGYAAEGIAPDAQQIAMARSRHGATLPAHRASFESFDSGRTYDVVVFQESAQYIPAETLLARAAALTSRVIVLDELALHPIDTPGALPSLAAFLEAAARNGFALVEEIDLTSKASPTIQYFLDRIPSYRERLIEELGLTGQQVDDLISSGQTYLDRYRRGVYGYRLLSLCAVTAAGRRCNRDT